MKFTTLQDILAIENQPNILDFCCPATGIPLWLCLRDQIIQSLIFDFCYSNATSAKIKTKRWAQHRAYWKTLQHNVTHRPPATIDTAIFSTTASVIFYNQRAFNRISDHFALRFPANKVYCWEEVPGPNYYVPTAQRAHDSVSYLLPQRKWLQVRSKFFRSSKQAALAADFSHYVNGRVAQCLGSALSSEQLARLQSTTAWLLRYLPAEKVMWSKLFDRYHPRLVLCEQGTYCNTRVLVQIAKQAGAHVADLQHGMISSAHQAYNFAQSLLNNPIVTKTMPDSILLYGQWWQQVIAAPVQRLVAIGSPHRQHKLASINMLKSNARPTKNVLVIGDGIETEKHLEFCARLINSLNSTFNVLFRPHPGEREHMDFFRAKYPQVAIDQQPDIYDAFVAADALVAEVSTALFEAIGLVERIFVWNTAKAKFTLSGHPFATVDSAEHLAFALNAGHPSGKPHVHPHAVWEADWQKKFHRFASELAIPLKD